MRETFSCADGLSVLGHTGAAAFGGMGGDLERRRYLGPQWHAKAASNTLGVLEVGMVEVVGILKHDVERDVCILSLSVVGIAAHCCHLVLARLLVRRFSVSELVRGQQRVRIVVCAQINANFLSLFLCGSHRVFTDKYNLCLVYRYFAAAVLLRHSLDSKSRSDNYGVVGCVVDLKMLPLL